MSIIIIILKLIKIITYAAFRFIIIFIKYKLENKKIIIKEFLKMANYVTIFLADAMYISNLYNIIKPYCLKILLYYKSRSQDIKDRIHILAFLFFLLFWIAFGHYNIDLAMYCAPIKAKLPWLDVEVKYTLKEIQAINYREAEISKKKYTIAKEVLLETYSPWVLVSFFLASAISLVWILGTES